ncbi:hypothetical protein ACUX4D_26370, partial [Salmonella enterica]|uniref:hypothetical protein n=1 Tax=Salmonella sp. L-S2582 TaxID=2933298 RepID=UPI001FF13CE1|nr:hypothetical protein [Salmonella sp. L-S2582]
AAGAANEKTDAHEQGGHEGEQHSSAHYIHGVIPRIVNISRIKIIPFVRHLPVYDGVSHSKLQ